MTSELRFDDEVAIVTGSGGGLGRTYAMALAERGAKVVINDVGTSPTGDGTSDSPAAQVVAEITGAGGEAVANTDDVVTGADGIVQTALDSFGRIDIVINNAGIIRTGPHSDTPDNVFDRIVGVHLLGAAHVCRAAWPSLVSTGGRIINISSESVFGMPDSSHYCAAKAGMIGLTNALAVEGAPHNVKANTLMPAAFTRVMEAMPDEGQREFMRMVMPAELVVPIIVVLAHRSQEASGELYVSNGGRILRGFIGTSQGIVDRELTPEGLLARWDEVRDLANPAAPANGMEQMMLNMAALAPALGLDPAMVEAMLPTPSDVEID